MESAAAPYIAMLMAECCEVGLLIIGKQAMNTGMTTFVLVSYSSALASLIILPFSLFIYRSNLPPLSFSLLGWFFLLALAGCLAQLFQYTGVNYSSPTLGAAMLNLVPGLTFLLAIIFRMEMLDTKSLTCLAKLVGIMVSIAGAFVVTLYKGPAILNRLAPLHIHQLTLQGDQTNWILGNLFLSIRCVLGSGWVILQAVILKKYPAELIVVLFYCFFVAIQSGIMTLILENDRSVWSLKPTLRLLAVLYSAIFGTSLHVCLFCWCLRKKGPVFVCMFKPLEIAIAAVAGVVFLGDTLYLGSSIGMILIVLGLYSVLWGKAKEEKKRHAGQFSSLQPPTQKMPLLENNAEETVNAAA